MTAGVGTCAWLYIGRIFSDTPTEILAKNVKFPTTTEGCLYENGTSFPLIELDPLPEPGQDGYVENSGLLSFYNISYHYIGFIGLATCATTGKHSDIRLTQNLSGFWIGFIRFWLNNWELNEKQKNGHLHYFFFDHLLFRWLPETWRVKLRFGLKNPHLEEELQDDPDVKIELTDKTDL